LGELLGKVGLAHLMQRYPSGANEEEDEAETYEDLNKWFLACRPSCNRGYTSIATAAQSSQVHWTSELSLGEKQRLAMARLLFWKPALAGTSHGFYF